MKLVLVIFGLFLLNSCNNELDDRYWHTIKYQVAVQYSNGDKDTITNVKTYAGVEEPNYEIVLKIKNVPCIALDSPNWFSYEVIACNVRSFNTIYLIYDTRQRK